jgi:hypothetical protein
MYVLPALRAETDRNLVLLICGRALAKDWLKPLTTSKGCAPVWDGSSGYAAVLGSVGGVAVGSFRTFAVAMCDFT